MKLSIIIATHARPLLLKRVLQSLKPQLSKEIEVIVIENSDGLAKARNTGWLQAKGTYVAYIDDDAVAPPGWIKNILEFCTNHPRVAGFGGPYTSLNQNSIPAWIPPEITTKQFAGKIDRPLKFGDEWLNGTNMIFKKTLLKKINGFNESLGVHGNTRAYGEETELQIRLHNTGYVLWYARDVRVQHEFAKWKQNLWYLLKNQFTHGMNSSHIFSHFLAHDRKKSANIFFLRVCRSNIPLKRRIYYCLSPIFYTSGMFYTKIKYLT